MIFRTFIHMFRSRWRSKLAPHDVGSLRLRVLPTDLDVLGHMNNGVYFSIMDLGRMDLMIRSGLWPKLRARGWFPVMASATLTFRKSLQPWQLFDLETRIVGYDTKAVFVEQRFVVDGEIFAAGIAKARFLKKGGAVSLAELSELTGVDVTTLAPPEWVLAWSAGAALPSLRAAAPSVWP